jgi:tripartite-type tricarboxylate transporter receptor subunit TctC
VAVVLCNNHRGAALKALQNASAGTKSEAILEMPGLQKRFAELGAAPETLSGEALGRFLAGETVKWTRIIRASGATMD